MSFNEVAAPAIAFARDGFPIHRGLLGQERFGIRDLAEKFRNFWPASAALYLSNGEVPEEGTIIKNPALASMLDYLANAERTANGSRSSKIAAARDAFYRGDVAREIATFSQERDGLLDRKDLSVYETFMEQPTSMKFGEAKLFKCGFWTQGPTVLQCLGILESPIGDRETPRL